MTKVRLLCMLLCYTVGIEGEERVGRIVLIWVDDQKSSLVHSRFSFSQCPAYRIVEEWIGGSKREA